jgi:quercetin dioxygenase-like cupin family protein
VHRLRPGDRRDHRTGLKRVELSGERPVTAPGSVSAAVRRLAAQAHAVVIEIEPGGVVGRHPAAVNQLFVVVGGSGWVSGDDGEREPIRAGEAVLWVAGEEHESGSEEGMAALVLESDSLA